MGVSKILCYSCYKVFSFKPSLEVCIIMDEEDNKEETLLTQKCPHCGKENDIYWDFVQDWFGRKHDEVSE